jgi:F0F1-type ATP synthase membrane subunit b/b'
VVAPGIETTLENRSSHIDELLEDAEQLKAEADKLEKKSFVILENAELESIAAEKELMASFREKGINEKKTLFSLFSKQSKEDAKRLSKSADDAFQSLSDNIDDMVNVAMNSISCSLKKNLRR